MNALTLSTGEQVSFISTVHAADGKDLRQLRSRALGETLPLYLLVVGALGDAHAARSRSRRFSWERGG